MSARHSIGGESVTPSRLFASVRRRKVGKCLICIKSAQLLRSADRDRLNGSGLSPRCGSWQTEVGTIFGANGVHWANGVEGAQRLGDKELIAVLFAVNLKLFSCNRRVSAH